MSHPVTLPPADLAAVDRALASTRSIRRRLDRRRPVAREILTRCIEVAGHAPNASNAQAWRWLILTDPEPRQLVAEIYRDGIVAPMEALLAERRAEGDDAMVRHSEAVLELAADLEAIPALVIPCQQGRPAPELAWTASFFGSIYPAVWSFQVALRARGLGSTFTTAHLLAPDRVADALGIPADWTQTCLIPVAHMTGETIGVAPRRPAAETIAWNRWLDGPAEPH